MKCITVRWCQKTKPYSYNMVTQNVRYGGAAAFISYSAD